MLRIFTSVKIQRLRPGLNPQTWVPEASMLTTRPPKPSSCCLGVKFEKPFANISTPQCRTSYYHSQRLRKRKEIICTFKVLSKT